MLKSIEISPRLTLVRFGSPITMDEFKPFMMTISERIASQGRAGMYVLSDLRTMQTFTPAVSATLVALMRRDNANVARNAVLLGPDSSPELTTQAKAMLDDAGSPARRPFFHCATALAWLSESLSAAEMSDLRALVDLGLEVPLGT